MRRPIWILTLAATLLGGCATTTLQTPAGFAAQDTTKSYDYRASDGEGVMLSVRTEKNDPHGDLQFWTSAIDVKLRKAGYQAVSLHDVASLDGQAGRQIRYVLAHQGRELGFWVTLFVTERHVVVVEAGGDTELLGAKLDVVEKAISSIDLSRS